MATYSLDPLDECTQCLLAHIRISDVPVFQLLGPKPSASTQMTQAKNPPCCHSLSSRAPRGVMHADNDIDVLTRAGRLGRCRASLGWNFHGPIQHGYSTGDVTFAVQHLANFPGRKLCDAVACALTAFHEPDPVWAGGRPWRPRSARSRPRTP